MIRWHLFVCCAFVVNLIDCAVIADDGDVEEQGLYSKSEHVVILTARNFRKKVYGQKHAQVIQFYNSFCGHCRAFAPKYKSLAIEVITWQPIIRLEVVDCSVEENGQICRDFEILAYPSIRYIHENFVAANTHIGDPIMAIDSAENVKKEILQKMASEQSQGRLSVAPLLQLASYKSYSEVVDRASDIDYYFFVFENSNSTVGAEIALDINDYAHVRIVRVQDTSDLARSVGIMRVPSIVAYDCQTSDSSPLSPAGGNKRDLMKTIKVFLTSKNYDFPVHEDVVENEHFYDPVDHPINKSDLVYYSDLEKTIKTSLHTEVIRYKTLNGEPLQALQDYLRVLSGSFPARANLREYLKDLLATINTKTEWSGYDLYELIKSLEAAHAPVYTSDLDYIGCKGSQPQFRGYTCGLWTLFHTLTVNTDPKTGPLVLKAMHGYVKHFFGCTECSEHFQAMAQRNKIFEVREYEKAILWLWISHNEVNLRLAGDITEDPQHPKIQYPSVQNCPECRLARGAWNLPAVYQYMHKVYGAPYLQGSRRARSQATMSPFSNLDIGMLSFLYMSP